MSHLAAIIPAPEYPFKKQEVATPGPGLYELLVKYELIALAPMNAKLAKLAIILLQCPTILGTPYGGILSQA